MLNEEQNQEASNGSLAIQAGGNVSITTGLTYNDVKEIALDVCQKILEQLTGEARKIAAERAEEITESFLLKLQKEYPAGIQQARDPDFQYALFSVQKEYARNGDKNLGDLLVDLLVDRTKQKQRDILQIVLNESLVTAPKLTEEQLAVLSIVFFFRYVQSYPSNFDQFCTKLDSCVKPFSERLTTNNASFQHLEFCGCGSFAVGDVMLERVIQHFYKGIFQKGFDELELEKMGISQSSYPKIIISCLNDTSKLQIGVLNSGLTDESFNHLSVPDVDRKKLLKLYDLGTMSHDELKQKMIESRPYMENVFKCWSQSQMKKLSLTSVGLAIGHANIKKNIGSFTDLSVWIN